MSSPSSDAARLPGAARNEIAAAALDASTSIACVLDADGTIVVTNAAWRAFALDNGGRADLTCEGANYLAVCESFARLAPGDPWATDFALQLRACLHGDGSSFAIQYPCNSSDGQRWYEARIDPFGEAGARLAVVQHIDITPLRLAEQRARAQAQVMNALARGDPLSDVLEILVRSVEGESPGMICSVFLVSDDGHRLLLGAAPSLPDSLRTAIDGMALEPAIGTCAVAATTATRVVTRDIAADPSWAPFREPAARAGLVSCWSEPIVDGDGKVLGTFGCNFRSAREPGPRDIDTVTTAARFAAVAIQRKRADVALHESQALFSKAFEHTAIGMGLVLRSGRYLKVNRALCDMLGYSEAELLAMNWQALTHPDDMARSIDFSERMARGELESFQHEKRYLHRDGHAVWTLLTNSIVRGDRGQPLYAVAQMQDISALKTAENERELLFQNSPDLLCICDRDGNFLQINPAWARVLGWTVDEIKSRGFLTLVHPDDCQPTIEVCHGLFTGHPVIDFENRYLCRDGSYRRLSWNCHLLPEPGLIFGVARDITERAAQAQAREALAVKMQDSQKMEALGLLAGGIAHDFNNLLAIMLGNLSLAQRVLARGGAVGDKLAEIEAAGQRAVDLVQQILAFSRKQPRLLRVLDLGECVQETSRMLRATIPAGIEITTRTGEGLLAVSADPTQLNQIVINLCTNAWHAISADRTSGGRIDIEVDAVDVDATLARALGNAIMPGPSVRLTVRDNGIGMDEATRARVFEPFFTTREVGSGTGLGLSVVHGIVAAHHGCIDIASRPGAGTAVRVYFPAASAGDAWAPPEATTQGTPQGDGQHVLFLDDETQIVVLARELLELEGYRVTGHNDAEAALADLRTRAEDIDLVVTDLNMPGVSGLDIAREVAHRRPELPVLLASGFVTAELQKSASAVGVRRVLHKPDLPTLLTQAVNETLHRKAPLPH